MSFVSRRFEKKRRRKLSTHPPVTSFLLSSPTTSVLALSSANGGGGDEDEAEEFEPELEELDGGTGPSSSSARMASSNSTGPGFSAPACSPETTTASTSSARPSPPRMPGSLESKLEQTATRTPPRRILSRALEAPLVALHAAGLLKCKYIDSKQASGRARGCGRPRECATTARQKGLPSEAKRLASESEAREDAAAAEEEEEAEEDAEDRRRLASS